MKNIEYKQNQSSKADILNHLSICDENFIPRLSYKVNLLDYSKKIFENATRIEAWHNNSLIGLIAAYQNEKEKSMFITNVSIEKRFTGLGIAKQLMEKTLEIFHQEDYESIKLEVNIDNLKAIQLYTKYNFIIEAQNNNNLILKLLKHE